MELKNIPPEQSSFALTLLSFMECVTYIIASFVGDWFKGKLVLTNVGAAGALALICLFWPVLDVNYEVILLISLCEFHTQPICLYRRAQMCVQNLTLRWPLHSLKGRGSLSLCSGSLQLLCSSGS